VKIFRSAVLLIGVLFIFDNLLAQIPFKLSYQGLLTGASDGTYALKFDIYNAPTGGTIRYTETISGVSVSQGTFNVTLGSTTTLPAIFSESLYVQITAVAGPAGLSYPLMFSPRSELTASPYSLAPWATSGGNLFYNGGNVGIGTTTPGAKLHVSGGTVLLDNPYSLQIKDDAGTVQNVLGTASDGTVELNGFHGTSMMKGVNGATYIYGSGSPTTLGMTVNTSGNVSIGTTPSGYIQLNVESSSDVAIGGRTTGPYPAILGIAENYPGLWGMSTNGYGIYGYSYNGNAAWLDGNVKISGTLTKASGSFMIDHPLDPENKYLSHSFVESPDMMNIYNGNVITDTNGDATITLPEWFEALNKEFRYQLTIIGGEFAQAVVSKEIASNQFSIRTDKPKIKVSWQVTGIRHDKYADAHRIPIEETKPDRERGHYQFPALYGQPEEKSIQWATHPEIMKRMKDEKEKRSIKGKE